MTGQDMTGKTSISYIENSFKIGWKNLIGKQNIFIRFSEDLSIRRAAFVLSFIGIVISLRKKKYNKFWVFALLSSLIFMYFYTFWHADGPLGIPAKYSPMIMIWIYMTEALGIFYIIKYMSQRKKKTIFLVLSLLIFSFWIYGIYQSFVVVNPNKIYELMNQEPENWEFKYPSPLFVDLWDCNYISGGFKEIEFVNNDVNNLTCPFILQEESILPGIYGSKGIYRFYNKDDFIKSERTVKNLLDQYGCVYFVFDFYCVGYCTSLGPDKNNTMLKSYENFANIFKNACEFELVSNHTIQHEPFLIYKIDHRSCKFG
ncbi:MAG TPA: hypothetical protein ENI51_04980 [Candidatus Atribacteria bacterium]|nr:hypothetical protein [Candidatus Atribacteria bacterium]